MDSLIPATDACMLYVTAGSRTEAESIARALVGEALVACVNVIGPIASIYKWKGAVEEAQEFVLIAKTRQALSAAAAAHIRTLHSYETPCIVTYAMQAGAPDFLAWIAAETAASKTTT